MQTTLKIVRTEAVKAHYQQLNEMQQKALAAYVELLRLKNYSANTIATGSFFFCGVFPDKSQAQ